MKYDAITDKGLIRETNEDSFKIIEGCESRPYVFIIADGMGGHSCGELASKTAVNYISDTITLDPDKFLSAGNREVELKKLIEMANTAVYQKSLEQPEAFGMGTTLTMAVIADVDMTVAHVGDSRLYMIRDGNMKQITEDHSFIEELVKKGSLTREEAENHPNKNIITRAIGCMPELDVDILSLSIENNDIFILCTDGLTNMLGEDEILELIKANDPAFACKQLIDAAKKRGGEDNITVIVIKCE